MAQEEPGPLEAFTTDELVRELARRFDCLIVSVLTHEDGEDREVCWSFGSTITCVGMSAMLQQKLRQAAIKAYNNNPDDC